MDDKGENKRNVLVSNVPPRKDTSESNFRNNPFSNDLIMECIIGHLSFGEVKSCRLLNKHWRKAASRELRRRSKIVFHFIEPIRKTKLKVSEVINSFSAAYESQCEIAPVSSFTFRGDIPWHILVKFVEDAQMNLENLQILPGTNQKKNKAPFELNSVIGQTMKRMSFEYPPFQLAANPVFNFYQNRPMLLQELTLEGCTIVLEGTDRLSLKKLHLGPNIKFTRNGEVVKKFVVNELFDFSGTGHIDLRGANIILDLDLGDCTNDNDTSSKEHVTLRCIGVRNWETCVWKIRSLCLCKVPFDTRNKMEIHELFVAHTDVDFSVVYKPSLLEKVTLMHVSILDRIFRIDKLQLLLLLGIVSSFHPLSQIAEVATVAIDSEGADLTINPLDLPKQIDLLSMASVKVEGDGVSQVNTLYLRKYTSVTQIENVLAKIKPQALLYIGHSGGEPMGELDIVNYIKRTNEFAIYGLRNRKVVCTPWNYIQQSRNATQHPADQNVS